MKRVFLVLALVVATAVGTAVAQANKGHGQHVGKGHGTVHGVVAAVGTDSITLMNRKTCDTKEIDVSVDTNIRVNGKAGTLADIKEGDVAKVKLAKDGSAKNVKAWASRLLHGTVKALATDSLTLKLRHSCEEPTVQVTPDTKIQVNGQKGTLADIKEGYRAHVKVGKDGNARWIKARAPQA